MNNNDYREDLLKLIKNQLVVAGYDADDISTISSIMVLQMRDFEISPRCTDLCIIDTESDNLIKLFLCTILSEGKSMNTVSSYKSTLTKFKESIDKPLTEVGPYDVRVWLSEVQLRASKRTADNYRSHLSSFYSWVTLEEIIKKNPMASVKPIKYDEEIKLPFSTIDIDTIRCSFGVRQEKQRAIFELLICSGIRANELCNVKIDDIDFQQLKLIVRKGKGGKQRITYITPLCAEYLHKYISTKKYQSEYLFEKRGSKQKMNVENVEGILRNIGKRTGINKCHPHRCRRTFATTMYRNGMDIRTIQKLLGHSNINTTMTYIAMDDELTHNKYRQFA